MTGNELKDLCVAALEQTAAGEDPVEMLLRLMLDRDPENGHHGFARTVDRLRALAPDLRPGEAVRGVARGEIALPMAWIGRSESGSADAPEVQVTLDGLSISVNGQTVDLTDPDSLAALADVPGLEVDGADVNLDSAHVVTQVDVQDGTGNVERRVILDGEEVDPAQLAERLADLPEDVRRMLLGDEES